MPPKLRGYDWVTNHVKNAPDKAIPFAQFKCSVGPQHLLLRLLVMNAKRLPKEYTVPKQNFESRFQLSFLLPVGPLDVKALFKLNANTGCIACGEKVNKRCAGCLATYYCSPECQTSDWKDRNKACKTLQLKGAVWTPITFKYIQAPEGAFAVRLNKRITLKDGEKVPEGDEKPENMHGMQIQTRLVKIALDYLEALPNVAPTAFKRV